VNKIIYPSVEKVIEINILVLNLIPVKKKDQPKVLNAESLRILIKGCISLDGDIHDKATFLLKEITKKHPFASGNRRTAFMVTKDFLEDNGYAFQIQNDPSQARILLGVREGFYSTEEIKEWLKHGKIKPFER